MSGHTVQFPSRCYPFAIARMEIYPTPPTE
jgi:hypothetical protein